MPKKLDLIGQKFGRWNIKKFIRMNKNHQSTFLCECICGKEKFIVGASLKNGSSKSCGCLKQDMDKNKMLHDYTGERIGRLTIIEQTEPLITSWNKKMRKWKTKCDCGNEKIIQTQTLRKQKKSGIGSCGCWSKERNRLKRQKYTKPYEFYLKRIINSVNCRNKHKKDNFIKVSIKYADLLKIIPKNGIGTCHYCSKPLFWNKYEEQKNSPNRKSGHNFDRIDNSKGYEKNNLIFCCGDCNRTRGDRFTYKEFMLFSPILTKIRKLQLNQFKAKKSIIE